LYEMASGRAPFTGSSPAGVISAILREQPAPLTDWSPLSPAALDQLVQTCLAKDPDARWQNAADLARALRWVGSAGPGSSASMTGARPSSRRAIAIAALVAVAALAIAIAGLARIRDTADGDGRPIRTRIFFPLSTNEGVASGSFAVSPDRSAI